jgi:4-amino-4-deoxy-L-arabinose transferase-like glycosyltransferase
MSTVLLSPADDHAVAPEPPASARVPSRGRKFWRGSESDPAWARPALFALLAGTALLYLWGLGASHWANSFYSAAVQAGTKSWKAFFFGSSDASNFITVDKTPASLWVMDLSARLFGVNAWSILVPQALEGVATVGLLYATIKRWFGPGAGLLAGAVLAVTPVAALMFRFNNPDALLALLLVAGAYAFTRALENGRTYWLVLAGAAVGFGFLAKELQAFLVLPAFGLVYLFAGPPKLGRRMWQLVLMGVAMLVSAGWWVAAVQLTPASDRPYIGGSQNNSFWNVLFGYNGFGRLTGNESGSVVGGGRFGAGGGGGSMWGPTGLTRLFNTDFGGQASWLIPAALLLLVATLVFTWNRPRTDRTRAAALLWGGTLVVTAITFSYGQGIIHPYYTVALAAPTGAMVAIGGATFWRARANVLARCVLAGAVAVTAIWAYELLGRTPTWHPALRAAIIAGAIAAGLSLLLWSHITARAATVIAIGAVVVGLAAPSAYSLSTASKPHTGAIPSAGPVSFGPGGFGRGGRGGFAGGAPRAFRNFNGNNFPNFGGNGNTVPNFGGNGNNFPNFGGNGNTVPNFGGGGRGGFGGLLDGTTPGAQITSLLKQGASGYRWTAAAVGANEAASYQLASGKAIMSIGGFNGTDPTPSLAQFEQYVAKHEIHYFIGGGGFGGRGGTSSAIASWVQQNFTSRTVNGVTVYDLSSGASSNTSSSATTPSV